MWEGNVESSCEPMNKNRIEGAGEQAKNRKVLVIKARWRRSGGCAAKECWIGWRNSAKLLNSVPTVAWFDQLGLPLLS